MEQLKYWFLPFLKRNQHAKVVLSTIKGLKKMQKKRKDFKKSILKTNKNPSLSLQFIYIIRLFTLYQVSSI